MAQITEVVDSSTSYHFVKQLVDRLSWSQRERLKREINLGTAPSETHATQIAAQSRLTGREQQVLALIADGYTRKEVGDALKISHNTASCHVSHIYEKLQISTIAEATRAAMALGIPTAPIDTRSTRAERRAFSTVCHDTVCHE